MPERRIDKPVGIIASPGRTGTAFLGRHLSELVPGSFSVHEPDRLDALGLDAWRKVRTFGFRHMISGRLAGRTGIRNLSRRRLSGELTLEETARAILEHRCDYYRAVEGEPVYESYGSWYGVLPALPLAFEKFRVAGVVRDPRDWVLSWSKKGGRRTWNDNVRLVGGDRIEPAAIGDHETAKRWSAMGAFERLCWEWSIICGCILNFAEGRDEAGVFHYEDLFLYIDRDFHFRRLLRFLSDFGSRSYRFEFDPSKLGRRVNASATRSEGQWRAWSPERARAVHDLCGELMERLGYGGEPEWCELIERAD